MQEPDRVIKLDLHVHAKERSRCAIAGEEEMIEAAIARGLAGLAFTDHGYLVPRARMAELAGKYAPFQVFTGIEMAVGGEDVLVLGLHDLALEQSGWSYPELHDFVRQRDGFLVLAHPFRFGETVELDLEAHPPDAIELRSMNIRTEHEPRIRSLAARLDVPLMCNSDAHRTQDVGRHYSVIPQLPQSDRQLVNFLKRTAYEVEENVRIFCP